MRAIVDNLDEIPKEIHGEYEQRDGKFYLKLDGTPTGFVPAAQHAELNSRLSKFRDDNIAVMKALGVETGGIEETLRRVKAFEGLTPEKLAELKSVDPAEYKKLKEASERLKQKGAGSPEELEVTIAKLLDEKITPIQKQLENEKIARAEAQKRADDAFLRNAVSDRFLKAGGRPNAVDFILGEAAKVFYVENDKIATHPQYLSPNDGNTPLSLDEWFTIAAKNYDFAFASSGGGGTPQTSAGGLKLPVGAHRLVDPTPEELGRYAREISTGKVVVVNK